MKKLIAIASIFMLLQGCATYYPQYGQYDDVYYEDDYYANDYYGNGYYADDYYASNYYPDRWGVNYSDVYYSPYRYPRVGFYNHYSSYPNSYWGSYSPWGYGYGNGISIGYNTG